MNNYFLTNQIVLLLVLVMLPALTVAQSGDDNEVEITNSDIIIFCEAHKGGSINVAREHGKDLFGSLEKFYENYHRIQCPPHFPSPCICRFQSILSVGKLMQKLNTFQRYLLRSAIKPQIALQKAFLSKRY